MKKELIKKLFVFTLAILVISSSNLKALFSKPELIAQIKNYDESFSNLLKNKNYDEILKNYEILKKNIDDFFVSIGQKDNVYNLFAQINSSYLNSIKDLNKNIKAKNTLEKIKNEKLKISSLKAGSNKIRKMLIDLLASFADMTVKTLSEVVVEQKK